MSNTTKCRAQQRREITIQCAIAATAKTLVNEDSRRRTKKIIDKSKAFADTGATAIFVMEDVPVDNKRAVLKPLTINLPDGTRVKSTHECDITIPGLPKVLTGHIVPQLTIASPIGIRVLCEAGCKVVFNNDHCDVIYNDINILRGYKDPTTDLWTLPIISKHTTVAHPPDTNVHEDVAKFTHSITTRANKVKFAHQSLCNPKISKLIKATRKGFLKGCPYISEELILKYLNPSPATAKGCMKRPRYGIKSTTPKVPCPTIPQVTPRNNIDVPTVPLQPVGTHLDTHDMDNDSNESKIWQHILPPVNTGARPNVIADDSDDSIANVFCFGAFADKNTGVMYHNMTGLFPFMSLDGCICYMILYH